MGIMRNAVPRSFVLICAVLSVQAAYLKDATSSRNSLANDGSSSSSKSSPFVPSSVSTHECLYVSPSLPICDFERMEDAEEDIVNSGEDRREVSSYRARRSTEDRPSVEPGYSERHVIVYTIEGCLPPRLPFRMPSCQEENSHGKIVEVRKLYPFTVKGLKKPPLVFPEFNFDRWMRMMKRLQNRTSSPANTKSNKEVQNLERNSALRKNASTRKSITPNKMISSKGPSERSSPNDILPYDKSRSLESPSTKQRAEEPDFRSTRTIEKIDEQRKPSRHDSSPGLDEMPKPKTPRSPKTRKIDSEQRVRKSEMYTKKPAHATAKSKFSAKDFSGEETRARIRAAKTETSQENYQRVINDDGAFNDLPFTGDSVDFRDKSEDPASFDDLSTSSRGRREVRRTADRTERGIHREPGIPAKSIVKRSRKLRETVNSRGNGLDVHGERNTFLDGYGNDFASAKHGAAKYEGIAKDEASPATPRDTVGNLTQVLQSDVSHTVYEKSSLDKISGRKKYGKYTKFGSKRDEWSRDRL